MRFQSELCCRFFHAMRGTRILILPAPDRYGYGIDANSADNDSSGTADCFAQFNTIAHLRIYFDLAGYRISRRAVYNAYAPYVQV